MFFCCIFSYAIQLILWATIVDEKHTSIPKHNYKQSVIDVTLNFNRYKKIYSLFCVPIILLDLFPFLAMADSFCLNIGCSKYEGGVLCSIMSIATIAIWILQLFITVTRNIQKEFDLALACNNEIENKQKQQIENQKQKDNLLKSLYGQNYISFSNKLFNNIIFSSEKQCVVIFDQEYQFKDILNYSLVDDAKNITTTSTSGDAKTSTGNMLGRAVVGGVLTGGVGAAVGAVSAKKNIETTSTSRTNIVHNYTLYININSLENPTIKIPIGNDTEMAQKLANTINVIIERNKNS